MGTPTNAIELWHPISGARLLLLGTTHVSGLHGCFVAGQIQAVQPQSVVLEVDEERYQQLRFRLAHLLHHDTASLMALTAADGDAEPAASQQQHLLPDALRWSEHKQQFALTRNEGVPLLLGSLYGSDLLQAALAADRQHAALVLADQPQEVTLARFRLLADGLGHFRQLLMAAVAGVAHAEALPLPASELQCNAGPRQQDHDAQQQQQIRQVAQLGPVLAAAAQLAAARVFHLFLQWWSMALSSQAEWYGHQVHPVFLLAEAGSSSSSKVLQQQLVQRGVEGVAEAAAAAVRLLDWAAAAGRAGGGVAGQAVAAEDVAAIRGCVESMEQVAWRPLQSSSRTVSSSGACTAGSSSAAGGPCSGAGQQHQHQQEQQEHLLPMRPWWMSLSERFASTVAGSAAAVEGLTSPAGPTQSSSHRHHHANFVAAAAYERTVMAERNAVLAEALWQQAAGTVPAARAAARSEGAAAADVVGVVGVNHLEGIALEWKLKQHQWKLKQQDGVCDDTANASTSGCGTPAMDAGGQLHMLSHMQVAATDTVASMLELLAAGAAGLGFVSVVNRITAAAAPVSSFSGSSSSLRMLPRGGPSLQRLALLLLPVCVSLLPLQRDAARMREASGLLAHVAAVNDEMMACGRWGTGAAGMLGLVQQQQHIA